MVIGGRLRNAESSPHRWAEVAEEDVAEGRGEHRLPVQSGERHSDHEPLGREAFGCATAVAAEPLPFFGAPGFQLGDDPTSAHDVDSELDRGVLELPRANARNTFQAPTVNGRRGHASARRRYLSPRLPVE